MREHDWEKVSEQTSKCKICGQYQNDNRSFMTFPCKDRIEIVPEYEPINKNKRYLGDAVYASQREDGTLVLTTEDGNKIENEIVIEFEVLTALFDYLDLDVKRKKQEQQ